MFPSDAGLATRPCFVCGRVMRACLIRRHVTARHPDRAGEVDAFFRDNPAPGRRVTSRPMRRPPLDRQWFSQTYLLHFSRPMQGGNRPQHYLGNTLRLAGRVGEHSRGEGARITRAARKQGIGFVLVGAWPGGYPEAASMKKQGNLSQHCYLCREGYLARRASRARRYRQKGAA